MGVLTKLKQIYTNFLISTANVQQNALNDLGDSMLSDGGTQKEIQNHTMSSALLNGEITQEVKLLRARYYKVLNKMESISIKPKEHNLINKTKFAKDANGDSKYGMSEKYPSEITYEYDVVNKYNYLQLKKVMLDDYDKEFPLEMVIKNTLIYSQDVTKLDTTDYKFLFDYGEIAGKYPLRTFSELVKIKMIDNDYSLLEFYIPFEDFEVDSKKPYIALTNDIEKCKTNKDYERLFIFGEFGFFTDESDIAVLSMRNFVYSDPEFIRFVKHRNYYIVKFKVSNVIKNFFVGDNYTMDDLDKLYDEKAPRKN